MASHSHLALPRARRRLTGLDVWMALVTFAGLIVLVRVLPAAADAAKDADLSFWVLAACVLPAELIRIPIWRRHAVYQIAMSRPFALALLTGWGAPLAIVVFMIARPPGASPHRRPFSPVFSSAAQSPLSPGAAGAVNKTLGGGPPLGL